jgi:predicted  nucleic acid-binding Zn-ribbon protein
MSDDLVQRLRDLGDHAALEPHMHHTAADQIDDLKREIQDLRRQIDYWRDESKKWQQLWEQAANRVMQLDPAFDTVFTTSPEKVKALRDAVWRDDD